MGYNDVLPRNVMEYIFLQHYHEHEHTWVNKEATLITQRVDNNKTQIQFQIRNRALGSRIPNYRVYFDQIKPTA